MSGSVRAKPLGVARRARSRPPVPLGYSQCVSAGASPLRPGRGGRLVIVAEFLFIAFVVGILAETWLGFLGTFLGLFALYRFTRLSVLLSLALSLYWGLLGYHLGAATGEFGVGPLLAALGFALGAWVHRDGFPGGASAGRPLDAMPPADSTSAPQPVAPATAAAFRREPEGEIIDAEYRVVS